MKWLAPFSPSQITETLFIGTTPCSRDYALLRALGVTLVINLRVERPPLPDFHNPPLRLLWLPTFDTPFVPIPVRALLAGVHAALKAIQNGGKVYVHCAAGVHRAPALGAAILIAQGLSVEQAMRLIRERRPLADPYIWYIRRQIERFACAWKAAQGGNYPQGVIDS